jgi:hypothetical protein
MDLFELLANGGDNEATYRAQNPWYQAGGAVFQQQLPAPRSSTEAFLGPILQGLAGGTMLGYGRRQADQAAYEDYRNNPLFEALKGSEDPGAQTLLRSYQGEEAPEGWTARQGKRDTILAALRQSIAQEERLKNIDAQNDLAKMLLGKDATINEDGKIVPVQSLLDIEAQKTAANEVAKIRGQNEGWGGDPLSNPDSPQSKAKRAAASDEQGLRKEFQGNEVYTKFKTSEIGFKSLVEAHKDKAGTSDLELVRGAIQAIEPAMAVREGEAKAVEGSSAIPDQWKASLNKSLKGGTGLPPEVRDGIMRIAARRYEQYANEFNSQRTKYSGLADEYGYIPDRVVADPSAPAVESLWPDYRKSAAAAAGLVVAPDGRKINLID